MRVLILRPGTTIESVRRARGDYDDWFRAGLALDITEAPTVTPHTDAALPDPRDVPAVLITGSAAMVTDQEDWLDRLREWLRAFVDTGKPTLGVCFGHQLLAQALGGRSGPNPGGANELGTASVELTTTGRADRLFEGLPEEFTVQVAHDQCVLELPPGAEVLATRTIDPYAAFAYGDHVRCVQFHPEFDADITRSYVRERADKLRAGGRDPDAILANVREDDGAGAHILRRFRRLVDQRF